MELISNSASDAFKAHLRCGGGGGRPPLPRGGKAGPGEAHLRCGGGASYLIAGEEKLDMEIAVRRIGEVFGVDELILGGGGTLNWSMVRDGLCDEISIVMMPLADGETDTASLFEASGERSSPLPVEQG